MSARRTRLLVVVKVGSQRVPLVPAPASGSVAGAAVVITRP